MKQDKRRHYWGDRSPMPYFVRMYWYREVEVEASTVEEAEECCVDEANAIARPCECSTDVAWYEYVAEYPSKPYKAIYQCSGCGYQAIWDK